MRETYRVLVGTQPKPQDPIMVDGKEAAPLDPTITPTPDDLLNAIPDDQSVPYQEFPDDEFVNRWLIRLGSVRCDPLNGMLLTTTPEKLAEDRRYVGVVAEDVYAPAATLKLRPRAAFADPDAADFARVEGRLQVDGRIVAKKDALLHGGKLSFQGLNGDEDSVPLWMQRIANSSGYDLRIHIGDQSAPDHRLTVGPTNGGVEQPVLAVRADDKVEILTGSLDFDTDAATRPPFRQMINLRKASDGKYRYGVGVQTNTTYFRSNAEFCWFKGGDHADGQSDPGGGGLQLRLDDVARLHFGAQTRQMLNLWKTEYGIGVQSSTLYARSNADFAWFRKGTHSDNRDEPGAGGVLAMKLDDFSNLTIGGGLTVNGNAQINGGKLDLREADGGTDTDIMQIARQRNSSDHNDLRLIIGDNTRRRRPARRRTDLHRRWAVQGAVRRRQQRQHHHRRQADRQGGQQPDARVCRSLRLEEQRREQPAQPEHQLQRRGVRRGLRRLRRAARLQPVELRGANGFHAERRASRVKRRQHPAARLRQANHA